MPLEGVSLFLQWQATQGNTRAWDVLRELVSFTLQSYVDRCFAGESPDFNADRSIVSAHMTDKPLASRDVSPAVGQAYLDSKQERGEVYRRLANS